MPLASAPYYFLVCDNCGERADYDEFTAYETKALAIDEASEWTCEGDVFHCPECPPLKIEDKPWLQETP
jgi:hypothetical protein